MEYEILEVKNSGLDVDSPVVESTDYHSKLFLETGEPILGVISPLGHPMTIFPDGHGWKDYAEKTIPEMQFNRQFDTFSCVVYSIAKSLVLFLKVKYNIDTTISEMFNAWHAGVVPNRGTSIRKGMESFRKKGWVEDCDYRFTENVSASDFFRKPPEYIEIKAGKELKKFRVRWETLPVSREQITKAMRSCPVILTGFAWAKGSDGLYHDLNRQANHAFLGIDFEGDKIIVDDTYPKQGRYNPEAVKEDFFKTLAPDFKIASAHIIWLEPLVNVSLLNKLKNMFQKIARDIHGGFWFIKDNKKQKITGWLSAFGAIIDEIGIKKENNNLSDEMLASMEDAKFFGK